MDAPTFASDLFNILKAISNASSKYPSPVLSNVSVLKFSPPEYPVKKRLRPSRLASGSFNALRSPISLYTTTLNTIHLYHNSPQTCSLHCNQHCQNIFSMISCLMAAAHPTSTRYGNHYFFSSGTRFVLAINMIYSVDSFLCKIDSNYNNATSNDVIETIPSAYPLVNRIDFHLKVYPTKIKPAHRIDANRIVNYIFLANCFSPIFLFYQVQQQKTKATEETFSSLCSGKSLKTFLESFRYDGGVWLGDNGKVKALQIFEYYMASVEVCLHGKLAEDNEVYFSHLWRICSHLYDWCFDKFYLLLHHIFSVNILSYGIYFVIQTALLMSEDQKKGAIFNYLQRIAQLLISAVNRQYYCAYADYCSFLSASAL